MTTRSPEVSAILSVLNEALDAISELAIVIDASGCILAGNRPWRTAVEQFQAKDVDDVPAMADRVGRMANPAKALGAAKADTNRGSTPPGDYFALAESAFGETAEERSALASGLREWAALNEGDAAPAFEREFSVGMDGKRAWFILKGVRMPAYGEGALLLLHRPVTELRKSEADLRESHILFHHTIEHVREGVVLFDKDGRFVFVNPAYAEALGLSVGQMAGKTIFEVFKPDLAKTIQEQNLLVLTTGQTLHFELLVETPRGIRHLNISKGIYRNHRNEAAGIFGVTRDISVHHRAEKTLEKSERHFRALIENSADRVVLIAKDATIRYASPSTKRILGFEIEEMYGTDAFLWVHPQDHAIMRRRFKELLERPGGTMTGQYRALQKDGGWLWMEATATNLLDDPSVAAVVINERDISERKEAESELMRFADIIESSNDAIISADPEGLIISWNPAAERIFGYGLDEILGKSVDLLVPHEWRKTFSELRNAALRKKGSEDVETLLVHKNGRKINVSLTLSPIRDRDGATTGFSQIVRDITDRRRLEKEILEISDREKQRIGQDLHDDLCQHLVGISLVANALHEELARDGIKQAEDARQVVEMVRHAVEHARSLARGLSPLNLVDTGFITNLEMLVSSTEQIFRVPCAFECQEPFYVKNGAVAIHLYRIAQEALHNAVKHSCASRVIVSLEVTENAVVVSVKDDGIGFAQGGCRVRESELSGGLGMHTMQYRARIIGATLDFESVLGCGTRVICRVPKRRLGR